MRSRRTAWSAPAAGEGILQAAAAALPAACLAALLLAAAPLCAQLGYGYNKGQDPMVLGIKKMVLGVRQGDWVEVLGEATKLDWLFRELREDLGVDLEESFLRAARARSDRTLSREISRLVYHAMEQKFHWNEKEKLAVFARARSRVEAAMEYYDEILSLGVQKYDRLKDTALHREVLQAFSSLRQSTGSGGLFGFQARPPDLATFRREAKRVLEILKRVYPHVATREPPGGSSGGP